jgi:hypothetical protein
MSPYAHLSAEVMNEGKSKRQGTAVSIFVGIGLFFILPLALEPVLTQPTRVFLPVFMACYFVAALGLALQWPQVSWRVGLWLFLLWPAFLLFAVFLSADRPWNWKGDLLSLAAYGSMLVAACFGGWLGAFVSKRRRKALDTGQPSP